MVRTSQYRRHMGFCTGNTGSTARLSAAFLLALTVSTALAQTPILKTRTKEEREEQFNTTHRITMNVQVTDAAGTPVSDLRPEDFTLYDNHQKRRIAALHPVDGAALRDATQVVILLDAVNTPAPALDDEKSAIFKYLIQSRKPFPIPIAFALWFNGQMSATSATTDRDAIGRAFVKMTKNLHSNACSGEPNPDEQKVSIRREPEKVDAATCRAVHFKDSVSALDGIAQQQIATGGRTLLIWMGSGWPALSEGDLKHFTPKEQSDYVRQFVTVLHDLRAAQVTVYSIASSKDKQHDQFPGADANVNTYTSPPIAVNEFANRTGGRVVEGGSDIAGDLRRCIRDADWYYAVSFNAPPAKNGFETLHSLEIKVNRPGLEIRTMNSYYPEPD
jgi:VWFA-related protein